MKNLSLLFILSFLFISCTRTVNPNQTTFVTLLGNDTLAVEQFIREGNNFTAKTILRSPRTVFSSYDVTLDEFGGIENFERRTYPLDQAFEGSGTLVQTINKELDSLVVIYFSEDGNREMSIANQEGALPFIDMIHWPFEIAFMNAMQVDADTVNQPLISGSRISNFIIAKIDEDSVTLRHPTRGVMGANVNSTGNLMRLDAAQTTRKVVVERTSELDMNAIGARFADSDRSGNPFGELSGAEEGNFSFNNTDFRVTYGSPLKRGRDLFGAIVPYGERWRTGANRATHFRTSKNLRMGSLNIPAGEYTLFSIPEADGGTLIINKQTGQNGQSYNQEMDLGRVSMERSSTGEEYEAFTILVEENGSGGTLKLLWGNTAYSVNFDIR